MEEHRMTGPGDRVLVGVSGGADSVCLLHLLLELGIPLEAVHINHCLRGEESDADEAFVRDLCRKLGVLLTVERHAVAEIATEQHMGLEEAGRAVRREAFARICAAHSLQKIALAHHAGDQAETLLFRAARGTSIAGMAGIRPAEGPYIRPLLGITREEIEAWLKARGIAWRTDSTNLSDAYARNSIRLHVIPQLAASVNPAVIPHLGALAEDMAEAEEYLRKEAARFRPQVVEEEKTGEVLLLDALTGLPGILQKRLILDAAETASGSRQDLGREQIRQIQALFAMQAGREFSLPGGLAAVREYRGVRLLPADQKAAENGDLCIPVAGTKEAVYSLGKWQFSCRILAREPGMDMDKIPRNQYTKWLDYDKIKHSLALRFRRAGDYLFTTDTGGKKKLKDYLIDEKVPRRQRDAIPVLASGPEVFWVVGMRISARARITEETLWILEIHAEHTGGET